MFFFNIVKMAGGLALFLYGMDTMSQGLNAISGDRMRCLLTRLTGCRLNAVLLGGLVTAMIQSSSAVTVMVVGMVNAGILNLSQATGVIMGANVGTTITAWLLAVSGIEGDIFFLNILKPSSFAPILAVIGIILLMAGKKEKQKNIGLILMGFAVLMTGMEAMCEAAAPMAGDPAFLKLLHLVHHPVIGILVGAGFTAALQSSSASVGILQILCNMGMFHYDTAIPIILGQNIGTCVTAMLAGVGASKNARRAALIHLYFNMIGGLCFFLLFMIVQRLFAPDFLKYSVDALGIAVVHSIYNIFAVVLLFPWTGLLERLVNYTIP